jgi:hypothetical protein
VSNAKLARTEQKKLKKVGKIDIARHRRLRKMYVVECCVPSFFLGRTRLGSCFRPSESGSDQDHNSIERNDVTKG